MPRIVTPQARITQLAESLYPGRTVKVMYATEPSTMSNDSDVFTTVTGLPASCRDVVTIGAAYRLISYLDPARVSQTSPQADEIDSRRPFGSSSNVTRQLFALYNQRLTEETSRQQAQFPPRVHYIR